MPPPIKAPLQSCPHLRTTQRCLSSRSSNSRNTTPTSYLTPKGQIPPESPKFIYVPQTRQPFQVRRPWVKGILPVPRQIFPRSLKIDKSSPEYLNATAPEPKPQPPGKPVTWRAQQSALRRRNFREGVVELYRRKQHDDRVVAAKSAAKQAEYLRVAYAPEPEDQRLTRPSVHTAAHPSQHSNIPDPNREERIAQKRANVAAKQEEREQLRRSMLHTLYVNARHFITTEDQLETAIDEAFDDPDQFTNDQLRGQNIWAMGRPETAKELMGFTTTVTGGKAIERQVPSAALTEQRLDALAEELTGGKM